MGTVEPTHGPVGVASRRAVLAAGAGGLGGGLAGCLRSPSSGGPPYRTHEIDDGPVYAPGLRDERSTEFYAAVVRTGTATDRFDPDRLAGTGGRRFVDRTEFGRQYLAVVQAGGINSSMRFRVPDVSESRASLTVIASLEDDPPYSEDSVITTLLIRVTRTRRVVPDRVRVELSIGDRRVVITGE